MKTKPKYNKEDIANMLIDNDYAIFKGFLRIYSLQTRGEKSFVGTTEDNGVGFTGVDGEIFTSIGNFYTRFGFITDKQFAIIKRRIKKYIGQLAKVANGKITDVVPVVVNTDWLRASKSRTN